MHNEFDELLLLYSAQSLDDEARAHLEAHLATCDACRAQLAEWNAIAAAVRHRAQHAPASLPPLAVPLHANDVEKENGMIARTIRAVPSGWLEMQPPAPRRDVTRRPAPRVSFLAAAILITIPVALVALLLVSRPVSTVFISPLTATPLPQPTETQMQVAPAVIRGGFELGGHVTSPDTPAADQMRDAGMTWMKMRLDYVPGMSADDAAAWIDAAHGQGFKFLLNVTGTASDLAAGGDAYVREYSIFLGQLATLAPDAIEVWSEPNLDLLWDAAQLGGASYVNLLRQAYQAVKAANPDVMVISAAPAPTSAGSAFPGRVMNDDAWLREVVDAGGLNVMDCLGAHYVEGVVSPTQYEGDPRDDVYTRYFGRMLDTYLDITGRDTPICWTELGYFAGAEFDSLPMYFEWASATTAAEQAEWLASAAALSQASGDVRLMIVWNVDLNADPDMAGYAIVRADGSCEACDALERQNLVNGRLIPPGFVASEIPLDAIQMDSEPVVGSRVTILLETDYERIEEAGIPYDLVPVIEDALLIEPRHEDTLLVVMSPQDAALLSWLLREEHPLRLR